MRYFANTKVPDCNGCEDVEGMTERYSKYYCAATFFPAAVFESRMDRLVGLQAAVQQLF